MINIGFLFRKTRRKLFLILVILLFLNIIRFYKQISTERNVSQLNQLFDNLDDAPKKCGVANNTRHIQKELYFIKKSLGSFYYIRQNSTVLSERCKKYMGVPKPTIPVNFTIKWNSTIPDGTDGVGFFEFVHRLKTSEIYSVSESKKGTQLKLILILKTGIKVIFKPKWYSNYDMNFDTIYGGKDRHYAEVVALYLSILLDIPRVPTSVIRNLQLSNEILPVITNRKLLRTFVKNGSEICFYGNCYYCNASDVVCTKDGFLEGAMIHYLEGKLNMKTVRHPWARTYKCGKFSQWETHANYCSVVKTKTLLGLNKNRELLLDIVDMSIIDFLMNNGDRHNFDYIDKGIPRSIIIDNGKSFANSNEDYIDILAPLYQCCKLRYSTWRNLLELRGGNLRLWLQFLLKSVENSYILNGAQYAALERRLLIVFATIKYCHMKSVSQPVIVSNFT